MPAYYAHLTFGTRVFAALPADLRDRIAPQWDAYLCGQYGPDPLFFLGAKTRAIARRIHHGPAKLPIANLSGAVGKRIPQADGYAAGFLCHFMLDSVCHPYVLAQVSRGRLNHAAIETEFDRFLMAQNGILATRSLAMPPMPTDYYVYGAAGLPNGVSAATYNHALLAYRLVSGAMTLASGTAMHRLLNAAGTLTGSPFLKGAVSGSFPEPEAFASNRALALLLDSAIDDCCGLLADFFAAADRGEIFYTPRLEYDFYGAVAAVSKAVTR